MAEVKHIIIFSHGFGVKRDNRGLFPEIAESLPEFEAVMFDYNQVDEDRNEVTVFPFSRQAQILAEVIEKARSSYPDAAIDIICHSQGSVAVALARPEHVRKVVFIAPPFSANIEKMMKAFQALPGTDIDMDGISRLARKDGTTTLVPSEYWKERKDIRHLELYQELSRRAGLVIIKAKQDEILDESVCSKLEDTEIVDLDGDHNFSGESRSSLLKEIRRILIGN